MKTQLIMKIGFIFNDKQKEKRVAGAADSKYLSDNLKWLDFTSKKIIIKTNEKELFFEVKKIDIFTSIAGSLNIGLTLYDEKNQWNLIHIGAEVHKILEL